MKRQHVYWGKSRPTLTTTLQVNKSYDGETLEHKIQRIVNNREPIKDGAPLNYSERKDGVLPGANPRTDRWDVAIEAMDKIHKSTLAKRENRGKLNLGDEAKKNMDKETGSQKIDGKPSTGDTESGKPSQ